ncbi:BTAD domain-containing putative transcriptional regulator [Streptomyces sp. NPDC015345]|jgi:DNA-binding SARP family transcriptional activator|uniref:AfsR/SARP family transcriptional regulator n=1 Tax=Streptomyces sp. NPDC015345 TaxID=3364953 RepID=UPI0036FCD296
MEFKILGHFEVVSDGKEICTPKAFKQRSLLALLVIHHDQCLSASSLAENLWGEEGQPSTARAALQVYISKIRRHLTSFGFDPDGISTSLPGYILRLGESSLDLVEFRALAHHQESFEDGGRDALEREVRRLRQALALWRGPALADMRDVPALRELGTVLDEAWTSTLERRLEIDLRLGRELMVLSDLRQLALRHPEREKVQALLMTALYRAGRTAEALATFRLLRSTLISRFGVEPGRMADKLHQAILAREPWLDEHADGVFASVA